MPYINCYVDIDLDNFDIEDLIDEIEDRGYNVNQIQHKIGGSGVNKDVENLYYDWLELKDDLFRKQLIRFFSRELNKNILDRP
jgi:hypothetical protein